MQKSKLRYRNLGKSRISHRGSDRLGVYGCERTAIRVPGGDAADLTTSERRGELETRSFSQVIDSF